MGLLSKHESTVWAQFQQGYSTSEIAQNNTEEKWTPAYTSRVLNRAKKKIRKTLEDHAKSHRLDITSIQDYKGILIGFDFQANTQVYIVYTDKHGILVWYTHDNYAGKYCHECPSEKECKDTLDTIIQEYNLVLRPEEQALPMTELSIVVFNRLAAKEIPRYRRKTN
jgi:hypothetical protein